MGKQQSGFTLVEVVAAFVVLGILAVTALPRFIDMSRETRVGVLNGVQSAMRGASVMVYAKSLAEGEETQASATVTVKGVVGTATDGTVATVYGYPSAEEILNLITLEDSSVRFDVAATGTVQIQEGCMVSYTNATASERPDIVRIDSGC